MTLLISLKLPNLLTPKSGREILACGVVWVLAYFLVSYEFFNAYFDLPDEKFWWSVRVTCVLFTPFVAAHLWIALQNLKMTARLRKISETDLLTGLNNRRAFFQKLSVEGPPRSSDVVLMLDIDHFKAVNDSHGHTVGDECLREVSQYLRKYIRKTDTICRYGGEEFAVVIRDVPLSETYRVAERICKGRTFRVGDLSIELTFSIGIARWNGYATLTKTLERADAALFQAKEAGRSRAMIHNSAFTAYGL